MPFLSHSNQSKLAMANPVSPISLEEAKQHLRVDADHDDEMIERLCLAATQYFENECNRILTDGNEVPQLLKQGILLYLAFLYEQREGVIDRTFSEVPLGVQRIAYMYAKPEVAG